MQVHGSPLFQQGILVPIDAGPIVAIRDPVAALDTFNDIVEFRLKIRALADACEVLKLDDVNRLGLGLNPSQSLPESRSGWLQSP